MMLFQRHVLKFNKLKQYVRCIERIKPQNEAHVCNINGFNGRQSLHTSSVWKLEDDGNTPRPDGERRISAYGFDTTDQRHKEYFMDALAHYKQTETLRRGHVEYIKTALKHMERFGVHKDLEAYKALMDVFPKVKLIPQNMFQRAFDHYPIHQDTAVELLDQMERNGVLPDLELQTLTMAVFGMGTHPMLKLMRMNYWMRKFNNLSPWPLPKPIPDDALELALLAVKRMCSVDIKSVVNVLQTSDVPSSHDKTWIVTGQSPEQRELLDKQPAGVPLKVEGPALIWLRDAKVSYFTLKADYVAPPQPEDIDVDDLSNLSKLIDEAGGLRPNTAVTVVPSVHEQPDGVILAVCVTGTSTRDSLLSWIRLLAKDNPKLDAGLPVVFQAAVYEGQSIVVRGEDGASSEGGS